MFPGCDGKCRAMIAHLIAERDRADALARSLWLRGFVAGAAAVTLIGLVALEAWRP